jgi:hypothetical protein
MIGSATVGSVLKGSLLGMVLEAQALHIVVGVRATHGERDDVVYLIRRLDDAELAALNAERVLLQPPFAKVLPCSASYATWGAPVLWHLPPTAGLRLVSLPIARCVGRGQLTSDASGSSPSSTIISTARELLDHVLDLSFGHALLYVADEGILAGRG